MTSLPLLLLPVVVVGLVGCSSSPRPTASAAGASARVSDPVGALLVADAPAGFIVQSDASSHTGRMDLDAAVRDDAQTDARRALTAARFDRGYARLWLNPAGEVVGVQLYRFDTASGARSYLARLQRVALAQASSVRRVGVPGVPAAAGGGFEVDVEGDRTEQVLAVAGRTVLQVVCTNRTGRGLRARAARLAGAQYRGLTEAP